MTGVLPILLGKATKVSRVLTRMDKEYVGVLYLHGDVEEGLLREVVKEFTGPIYQRPPVKSAVARELRVRRVKELEVLEVAGRYALLRAVVEAGTYIRKLFHDIGEVLGVGGSMRELRRVRSGELEEQDCVTLQDLVRAFSRLEEGDESGVRRVVRPVEEALSGVPQIVIKDTAVAAVAYGAALKAPGVVAISPDIRPGSLVAIFTLKGELVALGRARLSSDGIKKAERGVVADLERVVMERDLYPREWGRRGVL